MGREWRRSRPKRPAGALRKSPVNSAEEKGFEPLEPLRVRRFSKPLPSTTRPLLQVLLFARFVGPVEPLVLLLGTLRYHAVPTEASDGLFELLVGHVRVALCDRERRVPG